MFITNGYQALIDYRPASTVLFASTLRDKKSKPSFEPGGRVTITLLGHCWVMDIFSSHDNRLLVMALIKHFIFRNGDSLTDPIAVETALCQIADYGIVVRKLSEVVESEDSFIYDFKFQYTLKKKSSRKDEVISTIVYSLKAHNKRISNISGISPEDFNHNQVDFNSDNIFSYRASEKNTLIFTVEGHLFLTNITDSVNNRLVINDVVKLIVSLKQGFTNCSKSFTQVAIHSLSILVKSAVRIRPAMFITRDDGKIALFHRPFLSTEKSFEEVRPPLKQAAFLLKQVNS